MAEHEKSAPSHDELLRMVTDIVSSYVRHTKVSSQQLPEIITSVYESLDQPGRAAAERQEPAVPIRKSVTPDYLICLEDGKQLKMLKRYLMTNYGMTPQQYREKWGLPKDYPMVAPNYAKHRSSLAKESGLGRRFQSPGAGRRGGRAARSAG
ncbi:MAG TPA: MucR family transcriptional regulator [Stellaceae bacterium]|nr:MucR family transcriptional regulator [Stellaceae bacterium]